MPVMPIKKKHFFFLNKFRLIQVICVYFSYVSGMEHLSYILTQIQNSMLHSIYFIYLNILVRKCAFRLYFLYSVHVYGK